MNVQVKSSLLELVDIVPSTCLLLLLLLPLFLNNILFCCRFYFWFHIKFSIIARKTGKLNTGIDNVICNHQYIRN